MTFIDSLRENGVAQKASNTWSDYLATFFQHLGIRECYAAYVA